MFGPDSEKHVHRLAVTNATAQTAFHLSAMPIPLCGMSVANARFVTEPRNIKLSAGMEEMSAKSRSATTAGALFQLFSPAQPSASGPL